MSNLTLSVELGDASFDEAKRYFVTLKLLGTDDNAVLQRTDVSPTPTAAPVFKQRAFEFALPADAAAERMSLQLSAIAAVASDDIIPDENASANSASSKAKAQVIGDANLALGGELVQSGIIERRVMLTQPADGSAAGNILVTLRLAPRVADETMPPPAPAAVARTPPPPVRSARAAGASSAAAAGATTCTSCVSKERELAHQQALADKLMDDVKQKTAALAKAGEDVMELRGLNKRFESDLTALRSHVDERERALEQLATDATNVENIDLPQLQSRHRMLGAAYRADRRRMEQLQAQVTQLTAALGTQEQLAASYARLKEAHREQGQQMQRLQEEARKVSKYRQTAKQQESIIQRLEALLAAALKDAKRVKTVEPQLESLKKQHAELQQELAKERSEYHRLEEDAKQRERELQQAMAEGRIEAKGDDDDDDGLGVGRGASSEEHIKLLMRCEKAERRAAALEDEMQEMARANGREVAGLKMKLAEASAAAKGGFGSSASLLLGEMTPPGSRGNIADVSDPLAGLPGPPHAPPIPAAPLGSSRRSTPPGNRLDPLGGSGPQPVAAAS